MKEHKSVLLLKIGEWRYAIEVVTPDKGTVRKAYTLIKEDGEEYTCSVDRFGPSCTCGDYNWRRNKSGKPCKHLYCLRLYGMLEW